MTEFWMVFVTCEGRDQAERIAEKVVDERLAACVNVVPESGHATCGRES